ncbi:MAG: DMT family transporter [Bacteroidales bacterium]|nr:DMT family transporter [Bacteroidales bacterium]
MKRLKGLFFAIASSATFGLIPLLALPVLNTGMSTSSVLSYRFILSAIIMGLITFFKGKFEKISSKEIFTIIILGFFYAATALLLLVAYTKIPSGIATTIHFLYPLMVALIMIFFFKESTSSSIIAAIGLSLIGVSVLSWSKAGEIEPMGIVFALSSIFTYALYIVGLQKSNIKHLNEYALTFYILFSSSIFFLINALLDGGIEMIPDTSAGINLFLLALLPTVISDLTLILAVKYIGPTITSILGCMEPLTAVAIGVVVFKEPFGFSNAFGICSILIAVALVVLKTRKEEAVSQVL